MGQGYMAIILNEGGKFIRTWLNPHDYNNGYKLLEHSSLENNFVNAVEAALSECGMFYKSPLIWAGDYADVEPGMTMNLHEATDIYGNRSKMHPIIDISSMKNYRFIVNHTKKLYVDKVKVNEVADYHPLPLLTAEGNGRSGGDYNDRSCANLVGTWARDVISVEVDLPAGFTELLCRFTSD